MELMQGFRFSNMYTQTHTQIASFRHMYGEIHFVEMTKYNRNICLSINSHSSECVGAALGHILFLSFVGNHFFFRSIIRNIKFGLPYAKCH